MKLESSAFSHEGRIPSVYTCDGKDINPPLTISDVPERAQSLVLIMDDPDVPRTIRPDGMWDHWVVFNIPSSAKAVKEGEEPGGISGVTTGGTLGYHGPCPPDREHRYFFRIYALDTTLDLPSGATKQQVLKSIEGHVLAEAELMGRYERVKQ